MKIIIFTIISIISIIAIIYQNYPALYKVANTSISKRAVFQDIDDCRFISDSANKQEKIENTHMLWFCK